MSADNRTQDPPTLCETLGLETPHVSVERGGAGTIIGVESERITLAAFVHDGAAPADLRAAQYALEGEGLRVVGGDE